MKLRISIGNRQLIFLIAFVTVIATIGIAGAYNPSFSGGTPSIMGHSADEIAGISKTTFYNSAETKLHSGDYLSLTASTWTTIHTSSFVPGVNGKAILFLRVSSPSTSKYIFRDNAAHSFGFTPYNDASAAVVAINPTSPGVGMVITDANGDFQVFGSSSVNVQIRLISYIKLTTV